MLYLTPDSWHLISDTGTWHVITWHLIPDTWYMILDNWYAITHLIYFHMALVHLTWCCDTWLGYYYTCIIFSIHDYHFYGDLAWLLYCNQTFGTPELLCSWTPVYLNPLKRRDSWYYTPIDSRYRITKDIGLLWIPCGHYHWIICNNWTTYTGRGKLMYQYSLHVYDDLKVSRDHILGFDMEATRCFRGVYWHPYSPACQLCHKPLGLFLWER